eukprot:CAMPEP_0181314400 /NCGR_PEP_ID=MMETSP1101-20121128/14798_1 /TAXON_ID=46948 /ORGANISM="Rhodomonas abbreviata, Strain Caron Lab Isolate" /LENGTH=106 /DNA_ID=CAMNT_0023421491 /DNA_START=156 /DNA_END=472 /DNA_ORIENTATION=+
MTSACTSACSEGSGSEGGPPAARAALPRPSPARARARRCSHAAADTRSAGGRTGRALGEEAARGQAGAAEGGGGGPPLVAHARHRGRQHWPCARVALDQHGPLPPP